MYNENDYKRLSDLLGYSFETEIQDYRTHFRRDYGRLVHCPSFRRLQGKTQLFPGAESDFFRNRLTHSIEVAQIAKSIALKINFDFFNSEKIKYLKKTISENFEPIDTDLVEFACLAHDLGHPPFGHQGEEALDEMMIKYGGFEGNAQTLRIITRVEKKSKENVVPGKINVSGFSESGEDKRFGLDLTARTIASVLKYTQQIPSDETGRIDYSTRHQKGKLNPVKGYYFTENNIVNSIAAVIAPGINPQNFKTVECHIMDVADDIAYSTYDIEDALKAGFISLAQIANVSQDTLDEVVRRLITKYEFTQCTYDDIIKYGVTPFFKEFADPLNPFSHNNRPTMDKQKYMINIVLPESGYMRTKLTSELVNGLINQVKFEFNSKNPALSVVKFSDEGRIRAEFLKTIAHESLISSPRFKVFAHRGKYIVKKIFEILDAKDGIELLPKDYSNWYQSANGTKEKKRIICDFIASMTDNYAIEFYGRLISEKPTSIFKPF